MALSSDHLRYDSPRIIRINKGDTMKINRRHALALTGIAGLLKLNPALAKEDIKGNKFAAKRYINDVWNERSLDTVNEIFSPRFVPANEDDAEGLDALKDRLDQMLEMNTYIVEKIRYEIVDVTGEAENVFIRGNVTGTSSSAKKVKATFFVQLKFDGGLIVSEWSLFDQLAMMGL